MSIDYGESWGVQDWNYSNRISLTTLAGNGNFVYLLSGDKLLKLNISGNKSHFLSSVIPTTFTSIAVSYNGSLIVGSCINDNDIYISSSFGSQWSTKSVSSCIFSYVYGYSNRGISISKTGLI